MAALRDWQAYQACVGTVRRGGPGATTNLFASPGQIAGWCAAGTLSGLVVPGAALVLRTDRDLHHVYHSAEDAPALARALRALPPGRYAADLVGREDALAEACAAHVDAGFAPHTVLIRMTRHGRSDAPEPGNAAIAEPADAPAVAAFLESLLDPLAEQIPDAEELARAASEGRLLLVREAGAVVGMLMYDLTGRTAHLRFWHVDPRHQGRGIGAALMTRFLARCAGAQRIVLWVIGDNARSIAIYRRYGFAPDGLVDRVMVRLEEQHR